MTIVFYVWYFSEKDIGKSTPNIMERHLVILERNVVIVEGLTPQDARLTIDDVEIPIHYHEGFEGWGVAHTIYGFIPDLELLAEHIIVSNPSLVIGHGGHDEGGHHGR